MSVQSTVVSTSTLCLLISAIYCKDIPQDQVNVLDKFSWSCANNASCVRSVTYGIARDYFKGQRINFGLFSIAKLPPSLTTASEARHSKFGSLIGGNAIRIPLGPMVFSIARADDDKNYIELALMKSGGVEEARRRVGGYKDKKQLQLYIPMYLAASTFGWTMLAVKAVGVLTLKALLVSKIAFIVTVMMIVKKLMDTSAKMMYPHFPEHQPFMLPYDYGLHSHGLEGSLGANEFYPVHIPSHQTSGVSDLENVAAETAIHHRTVELHNGTLPHHPIVAALAPKITKREDGDTQWTQAGAAVWCNSPEYYTTEWSIMCLAIWGVRIYVWLKYYLDKFNLD